MNLSQKQLKRIIQESLQEASAKGLTWDGAREELLEAVSAAVLDNWEKLKKNAIKAARKRRAKRVAAELLAVTQRKKDLARRRAEVLPGEEVTAVALTAEDKKNFEALKGEFIKWLESGVGAKDYNLDDIENYALLYNKVRARTFKEEIDKIVKELKESYPKLSKKIAIFFSHIPKKIQDEYNEMSLEKTRLSISGLKSESKKGKNQMNINQPKLKKIIAEEISNELEEHSVYDLANIGPPGRGEPDPHRWTPPKKDIPTDKERYNELMKKHEEEGLTHEEDKELNALAFEFLDMRGRHELEERCGDHSEEHVHGKEKPRGFVLVMPDGNRGNIFTGEAEIEQLHQLADMIGGTVEPATEGDQPAGVTLDSPKEEKVWPEQPIPEHSIQMGSGPVFKRMVVRKKN